jgi:nicotinamide-nucleotide amidase
MSTDPNNITARLIKSAAKIAVAESCTGGLLSAALTELAGSSQWFDRGFVVYSNNAKMELLAIPQETLTLYGAVSQQTAQAMAESALKNSHANIALSITGIAGPEGGSQEKPVGTVWFGLARSNHPTLTIQQKFSGSRAEIRLKSVNFALELLDKNL